MEKHANTNNKHKWLRKFKPSRYNSLSLKFLFPLLDDIHQILIKWDKNEAIKCLSAKIEVYHIKVYILWNCRLEEFYY